MHLDHLSASSIKAFQACEAQWSARYIAEVKDDSNNAARLGTACHNALEWFVKEDLHKQADENWDKLLDQFSDEFNEQMPKENSLLHLFSEGREMLFEWCEVNTPEYWDTRSVVSTEQRREFMVPVPDGTEVPMVYIIDRLDRLDDGSFEVVDYKSGRFQLSHEEMRSDVQAQTYATSVWVDDGHPTDADWSVGVTFDYLRDTKIGVYFKAADCLRFYKWLGEIALAIKESDGSKETVNSMCRFCVRKHDCETLAAVPTAPLDWSDLTDIARRRKKIVAMTSAAKAMQTEIDSTLKEMIANSPDGEIITDEGVELTVGPGRRIQSVDTGMVQMALTTEPYVALKHGQFKPKEIEAMMADEEIAPDVRLKLKSALVTRRAAGSIKIEGL